MSILIGPFKVLTKGKLDTSYNEFSVSEYMKEESIDVNIDLGLGNKKFTAYTMDLTKEYVQINADYKT